jgi:hypothetical protein
VEKKTKMLKPGQIIELPDSGTAEVLFVNESRARVKLIAKVEKKIQTALGEEISFLSAGRTFDISPNSELRIIKNKR